MLGGYCYLRYEFRWEGDFDEVKEQLFILGLEEKQAVDYLPQSGRVK